MSAVLRKPQKPATLSADAKGVLLDVAYSPLPTQAMNPDVLDRLLRDALIEITWRPSPYTTHDGKKIQFAQITDAGRALACISN